MDIDVRGVDDLQRLARALKETGDKQLRKEFYAGLQRATKPIRADMQASIPPSLPSRGGLASDVHRSTRLVTSTTGAGKRPGVRIRARGKRDIRSLNRGVFRHPVFGSRRWVTQTKGVAPGFLDESFQDGAPDVRDEVLRAIADIAQRLYRKVG